MERYVTMIEKLKRTEAIILAIVCGCIIAAGLNSMIVLNNIARIEAHVDSMAQMMCYCMTNRTAKAIR